MANELAYLWRFHRQRKLARLRKRFSNHHSKRMLVRADVMTSTPKPGGECCRAVFMRGQNRKERVSLTPGRPHIGTFQHILKSG